MNRMLVIFLTPFLFGCMSLNSKRYEMEVNITKVPQKDSVYGLSFDLNFVGPGSKSGVSRPIFVQDAVGNGPTTREKEYDLPKIGFWEEGDTYVMRMEAQLEVIQKDTNKCPVGKYKIVYKEIMNENVIDSNEVQGMITIYDK